MSDSDNLQTPIPNFKIYKFPSKFKFCDGEERNTKIDYIIIPLRYIQYDIILGNIEYFLEESGISDCVILIDLLIYTVQNTEEELRMEDRQFLYNYKKETGHLDLLENEDYPANNSFAGYFKQLNDPEMIQFTNRIFSNLINIIDWNHLEDKWKTKIIKEIHYNEYLQDVMNGKIQFK